MRKMFLRRHKWEAASVDYWDKLSEMEKRWLQIFQDEFHNGAVKKGDRSAFHSTDELRRDCYTRNNAGNRDIYKLPRASLKESRGAEYVEYDMEQRLDQAPVRDIQVLITAILKWHLKMTCG